MDDKQMEALDRAEVLIRVKRRAEARNAAAQRIYERAFDERYDRNDSEWGTVLSLPVATLARKERRLVAATRYRSKTQSRYLAACLAVTRR